ncbi:hypothetical protein PYJP_06580 [Pyrofollis japonicus]|uniref:antitoxin VapB family protein n=1 Tax=Pyrofollis japonicus TaxID=3060460 RepID=UPI00295AD72B|nr:antitoxin VapB family protein [Pyrofollis japonicus]BEP17306.1 hypothetical protein PYJP_06580 [Pyrofollis japonicus]
MDSYVTISVRREVKKLLERDKGDKNWSEYLLELYKEAKQAKARQAFEHLVQLLNDKDLEEIEKASRDFRKRFRLR